MTRPFDTPIDARSGVPFYRQIIDRVMLGLADGTLTTGDKLPTVRSLAVSLLVNPNTVARAYRDLELLGVVETHRGSGTYVASRRPKLPEFERQRQLERLCTQLATKAQGLGFSIAEVVETLEELGRSPQSTPVVEVTSEKRPPTSAPRKSRERTGS